MTKTVSVMKVKKSREDKIFYAVSYTFVILLTVIVLCRFMQNFTLHRQSGDRSLDREQEVDR